MKRAWSARMLFIMDFTAFNPHREARPRSERVMWRRGLARTSVTFTSHYPPLEIGSEYRNRTDVLGL